VRKSDIKYDPEVYIFELNGVYIRLCYILIEVGVHLHITCKIYLRDDRNVKSKLIKTRNSITSNSEAFKAVMFQVEVFWVVTPCSVVVGYQHFGGPCWLHHQRNFPRLYPRTTKAYTAPPK
jgi:hypothetical protein